MAEAQASTIQAQGGLKTQPKTKVRISLYYFDDSRLMITRLMYHQAYP